MCQRMRFLCKYVEISHKLKKYFVLNCRIWVARDLGPRGGIDRVLAVGIVTETEGTETESGDREVETG